LPHAVRPLWDRDRVPSLLIFGPGSAQNFPAVSLSTSSTHAG
jgi:hypothetical protein